MDYLTRGIAGVRFPAAKAAVAALPDLVLKAGAAERVVASMASDENLLPGSSGETHGLAAGAT